MHLSAGAVTTWVEVSDVGRKMERYTDVVNGLRKIRSWWKVQRAVQKSSKGGRGRKRKQTKLVTRGHPRGKVPRLLPQVSYSSSRATQGAAT